MTARCRSSTFVLNGMSIAAVTTGMVGDCPVVGFMRACTHCFAIHAAPIASSSEKIIRIGPLPLNIVLLLRCCERRPFGHGRYRPLRNNCSRPNAAAPHRLQLRLLSKRCDRAPCREDRVGDREAAARLVCGVAPE